ncbi:unnamed protein product [Thelazia callipaeda]|uniref:Ovule protein n=1 Tax=Thelazia callipaeda TaxID=103827 RepID=A0A0N5D2F6_THECL|nr:unnamed protein product [Thelazia callipaeda]
MNRKKSRSPFDRAESSQEQSTWPMQWSNPLNFCSFQPLPPLPYRPQHFGQTVFPFGIGCYPLNPALLYAKSSFSRMPESIIPPLTTYPCDTQSANTFPCSSFRSLPPVQANPLDCRRHIKTSNTNDEFINE